MEKISITTHMTMNVQLIPMRVRPLLLLRSRHTDPKQIWVGSINGINDSLVVLIRELRAYKEANKSPPSGEDNPRQHASQSGQALSANYP
jgi:hypothetical protein